MIPLLRLQRSGPAPLHEQLAGQLRRLILEGELSPGTRLPPTREAAQELGVSRKLVVAAYEQLRAEGYLEARVGSGTRVGSKLPGHLLGPERAAGGPGLPRPGASSRRRGAAEPLQGSGLEASSPGSGPPPPPRLSRQGERLAVARGVPVRVRGSPGPFLPGTPAASDFPVALWTRLSARAWRRGGGALIHYGEPGGYAPLREAVADHVRRYRAVRCEPHQVVVTTGSQQALDLVARMLVDPDDPVGLEEPGYRAARLAFAAVGARLVPLPVDGEGVAFPEAEGPVPPPHLRLLYTTPSHQYPLGVTLSLARRLALLEWAREASAWIVEDDYDSEFRYGTRPLPSLQGLDRGGRVLYIGTLSKVLAPGLRLGYLILPEPLVEPFLGARTVADVHSPLILQATLAEFMAGGYLERHVARLRGLHQERRDRLVEALDARFGDRLQRVGGGGGLHITVFLPPGVDDRRVSREAARRGIEAPPLSDYGLGSLPQGGLVLGFGAADPEDIAPAVDRLAEALDAVPEWRRPSLASGDGGH